MPTPPDEVSRKRGRPPKGTPPKPPVLRRATRKEDVRESQTKSALYHLTPQELRFARAVAMGRNNTEAVKEAGYDGGGDRARARAWRLMQRPVVRAAIYELKVQAFDKASIEVTQWLRETASIAFMPPEMLEGKPRWSDKMNALTKIGEYSKILNQPQSTKEVSIIQLITQAAIPKVVAEQLKVEDERSAE